MNITGSFRKVLLIGLSMPIVLFILGAYNGVMQTIYRAGVIHKSSVAGINYYQGLTMHGVINAIVLTTFFAVVFGHYTIAHYLKKEPPAWSYKLSMILMITGTLLDAITLISGSSQALFTFYPPLKDSPIFYIGTPLLIIGSWVAFFGWIKTWLDHRKEHPGAKMPLAILGTFVNFTIWLICTLPVAYEVLVILLPWSIGLKDNINVPLTRMLFWMFGHPLVYFWLLPAYICFYTVLPEIVGGKLYSENAGRLAFLLFMVLSIPIGVHHQFTEPVMGQSIKLWVSVLTLSVAIPSFMTAFTVGASLEYAGRKAGARGLLGWMVKLPYMQSRNYLFGYFICGLILFIFGGATGIVNASYSLNQMIHNTSWVPGHFHMTVAGPVFLVILGMSMYMYHHISGKPIKFKRFLTMVPYVWVIGIALFSHGLMAGGLMGEPRRTNMGLTYTNPSSPLYNHHWVTTSTLTMFGGLIMGAACLLYFISFFGTVFAKQTQTPAIELPVAEPLHEEKAIPALLTMKPWIIFCVVLTLLTYIPSLLNVYKYSKAVKSRYETTAPVNLTK